MFRNGLIRKFSLVLVISAMFGIAACGTESGQREPSPDEREEKSAGEQAGETTRMEGTDEQASEFAKAEVGPEEATNMTPADGEEPDQPQHLPEDPPEGVKVYPATTNATVEGGIDYERNPPTNGDHSPIWQNCGFYSEPIDDRTAVHSMDHGVVWISYRPNLPEDQIDELRSYANEDYTIISPYPDLPAPVVATAWRVQLKLDSTDDPRLRQFVDDFKNTELAPLSGNRCVGGEGEPES